MLTGLGVIIGVMPDIDRVGRVIIGVDKVGVAGQRASM